MARKGKYAAMGSVDKLLKSRDKMKMIFDSEEEKEEFCGGFCPSFIGMRDSCSRTGKGDLCVKCWDAAVECEVRCN